MVFDGRAYSVLVVSSSAKFDAAMRQLLAGGHYDPVIYAGNVGMAKRYMLEQTFDLVIVNSPLPDDTGIKLAVDISGEKSTVCLLLVKPDISDEVHERLTGHGVFYLAKPTTSLMISQGLEWMTAVRERLRRLEKKTVSIEEKMEEIRYVNRAKWLLIEHLKMSEADAHRYIEKQAMDGCISRCEVAKGILKIYE